MVTEKKPFYKRKLFIIIAAILVIAFIGKLGGGGANTDTAQASNTTQSSNTATAETPAALNDEAQTAEKEYVPVDAGQMLAELESNALKAEKTYKNSYVEATGKVYVIDSSGKYISIDGVNDEFTVTGIMCNLTNDEQRDVVAEIEKGQTVVVKGEVTDVGEVLGYSMKVDSIAAQ